MKPLVAELVRAGAEVKGRSVKCPWHDDRHASGSIYQDDAGVWRFKCMVCGVGGDVYDLRAKIDGKPLADVLREAPGRPATQAFKGKGNGKRPPPTVYATLDDAQAAAMVQVQAQARRDGLDSAGVKFSEQWQYTAEFYVARFDLPQIDPDTGKPRKTFRPLSRNGNGWSVADPPGLLPLYGADKLPPTGPVSLVEGERKVDALYKIGVPAVTSAHGAKSPEKSDWRPLAGRELIGLPDSDESGTAYVDKVGGIVTQLSPPATVRVLVLPGLPPKGDVVDFLGPDGPMDGKTEEECRERILELAKDAVPWAPPATQAVTVGATWPDPRSLPDELPAVLPFDYGLLPEAFGPWVQDIAERTQCPPDFPAVGAMVALAGVVGRKIGIRPKRLDDWLVIPNLWGAVIGRPGIMKTPALRQPLRPLQRLEIEAKERFDERAAQYEAAKIVADATRKVREDEIRKAIKDGRNALAIAASIVGAETPAPVRRRYLVNDSTVEKLGEILNENPNGVTTYRDELVGLLRSLDREGQEGARAFYLEAWAGDGRFTYDRIGRGTIDIEATTVSIIGGIQPGRLSEYLRGAVKGGGDDDGLIQRFQLAVWPDVDTGWVNVDRWPDTPARDRAYAVFTRLDGLDPLAAGAEQDEHDPNGIPFLRFTKEAQDVFDGWRAELEKKVRSGDEHPAMEAHLAKYRSLIPSLALLVHLADDQTGPVGLAAVQRAIRWGVYLESHARRMYALAVNPDLAAGKALARRIQAGAVPACFALRDLYRNGWSGLADREDAERAVSLLLDLDWLRQETEATPGRDRKRFFINPKVVKHAPQ
jgi:putative DNA primase/helicase